jgi:hypothetical protein
MEEGRPSDVYAERNDSVRIEIIDQLEERVNVPLIKFFERLGIVHAYWELVAPTLARKSSLVGAAVQDRPWPPWGVGAQTIHSLLLVHPVGEKAASLANVLAADEDTANIALQAAVYKETLEHLARKEIEEVSYVVLEGAVLADRVLCRVGFEPTEDLFLTEEGRYLVYRAHPVEHLERLGLGEISTPEILAGELGDDAFERTGSFLSATFLVALPFWRGNLFSRPEILVNTGGGLDASQPGGSVLS